MSDREEATLEEVADRIREGTFYYDYDWASGPALRALDRAIAEQSGRRAELHTDAFDDRAAYLFHQNGAKMSSMILTARTLAAEFGGPHGS